ncbi:bifunctional folylpolyglutamate synthase/dihydrofolate synthase [filamentous cyanobacterium LEGE 11480]|uniref:tetrahydrofolate synthase n=1 Tax=Romeriopsis navalis LEGE 11480 TaxID=2777977 RepID=A0A928VNW5_9CYAN|nr:folylpolyglutamate synthase/dihydrofolate synthase family protein [Romeriopsis navalis]MBE9031062.1 bifunctional folylpolyglutamate synthase/dihydrofolate synthase [Romeriopsis navalis LEGE 11480]
MAVTDADISEFLQQFARFGVNLGLEASEQLLEVLQHPQDRTPIVHVAGSNGKGSVCAYISSILTAAGYRTGRYTSPHLVSWTERICINDQPIDRADLWATLEQVKAAINPDKPSPTQFEVFTAAMWLYFAQRKVDVAVIEVGLGGRLDATNITDECLVSIITSVSLEHTERLGDTLAKVAYEKAGILKNGCPAVIGELPESALAVVSRAAFDRFCATTYPTPAKDVGQGSCLFEGMETYEFDDSTVMYAAQEIQYQLPLEGEIQRHNSALAIAAIQRLHEQGWEISDTAIVKGIANTQWPGRLQWYDWKGHRILIDGAHNPASAQVLSSFVANHSRQSRHWVIGMLSTKNHTEIFQSLLQPGDSVYFVPVPEHSSAALPELVSNAKQVCPDLKSAVVFNDVQLGLQAATIEAKHQDLVILCGSLYLLGHFFEQEASIQSP